MSFYRRDSHVMEIQIGSHTKRQEDACTPLYFNRTSLPFTTLVSKYLYYKCLVPINNIQTMQLITI